MPLLSSPHEDVRSHVLVILSEVVRVVGQATATATTASSSSGSGTSTTTSGGGGSNGSSGGSVSASGYVMSTAVPVGGGAVGGGGRGDRSQYVSIVYNIVILLVKFVKSESVVELVMASVQALIMVSCICLCL